MINEIDLKMAAIICFSYRETIVNGQVICQFSLISDFVTNTDSRIAVFFPAPLGENPFQPG